MWAALLGLSASSGAALWIASVAVFGHRLHQPLHDPEVRCPLLPELGVGPRSARALYRCGSLCAALLLAVQSALHWELSLPHLPGGQAGDNGFSFACLGLTAATGLALQGVFLWDARWSMPAVLHLLGHLLFLFSTWGLLAVGFALYLPEADRPVHFKYNWLDVREQHFQDAQEAASSRLLTLWHMRVLLALRHWLLARLPWFSCLIPVCYWMWERWWIKIKDASTAQMREVICTSHWLIILSLAALHISFGPELATAATLPAAVYA
ncbi:unnamed protein product [Prorocentrum cordatum]|uniref:Glycerophosphocholine acyltransferase 1 n=1 Tax=Prorocentrum cordatum TaxID=2364126 RepID=A0ABN9RUY9_9DINO|nr:unnamed protein product [Polarella glacialis]